MKCPCRQVDDSDKAEFSKKCGKILRVEIVCRQYMHSNRSDCEFREQRGKSLEPGYGEGDF